MIGMLRAARMCALVALGSVFAGCGGGGSALPPGTTGQSPMMPAAVAPAPARPPSPPPPKPSPPPAPTPTAVPSLSPASAAYLALDLAHLANYARPVLPVFYDAAVRAADNTPAANPVTDAGATLGRVLFNDKRLSTTGAVSCASCHQQRIGFTDGARFSQGVVFGSLTAKHAMRLGNVRYYAPGSMFWDKRAASVETQAAGPLTTTNEMGWDGAHGGFPALTAKMAALPYYPELFRFVYGDPAISQTRIQNALAQFERSMVTTGSRWDAGYAAVYDPAAPAKNLDRDLPNFSAQENRGRHLFMAPPGQGGVGCAGCHVPPTFALSANSKSNGLDAGQTIVFKSPSLKNAGQGPYMHDGRFATLAQVVDHYDSGVLAGPALDPRLARNGVPLQLHLSPADKAALVAFLATLDDPAFFADPRFASPFKK